MRVDILAVVLGVVVDDDARELGRWGCDCDMCM